MSRTKIGVVIFPGSNCDHDTLSAFETFASVSAVPLWHKDHDLQGVEAIVLPGGFSYGDYLRTGAVARFSPIMNEVIRFANSGRPVVGICNGFQILLEAGLLEGAMMRNDGRRFICKHIFLRVETTHSMVTSQYGLEDVIRIPIAHGEGKYFASETVLQRLEDEDRILFRYCNHNGKVTQEANPNGSLLNIAGITNLSRNVIGLMPHPERALESRLGSNDGVPFFSSLVHSLKIANQV